MPIESFRVEYRCGSTMMKSFISKPEKAEFAFPGVLVFPEWWGLTEYLELRTQQLAELGYVAMAVDMYEEQSQHILSSGSGKYIFSCKRNNLTADPKSQ